MRSETKRRSHQCYAPGDLPAPRTALIGRERDVAETRDLMLDDHARLVTLTGVGGCGKTRLALAVAEAVRDRFHDGVLLLELAPIRDALFLIEAMASLVGVAEGNEALFDAVIAALRPRSVLLVLDNCEHLVDDCARLADRLLSACPGLSILATSREPLKIAGERQRPVLPLAAPDPLEEPSPSELCLWPAVRLFVERARAVRPDFRLLPENAAAVAKVCSLLEGIPLALELAAARVRVLSAEGILQRLDDCPRLLAEHDRSAPPRQQTLKSALDWSHGLLTASEQTAFRRLSVLTGCWTLEAAEAICEEQPGARGGVLEVLSRLVDKSLVLVEERAGEAVYRMLEPVRQYSQQLLSESGEREAAYERLKVYCVNLVREAESSLLGREQAIWLRRLDRELDTIRAASRWAEADGDTVAPLRLAGPLYWYFWMRSHLRESQRWLEAGLARAAAAPTDVRAKALYAVAWKSVQLADYPKGLAFAQEALALYGQLEDARGLALTSLLLSHATLVLGQLAAARAFADDSLAFARATGSPWAVGHALLNLGQVAFHEGEKPRAIDLTEQALSLLREQGDPFAAGFASDLLAGLRQNRSGILRAGALCIVRLYWEQGDYHGLAAALESLAAREYAEAPEQRVRLFAAAHTLRKSLGAPPPLAERDDLERHLASARTTLGQARFAAAWDAGCAMSLDRVVASILEDQTRPNQRRAARLGRVPASDDLTPREKEVVRLVARGYSDREIGAALTITEGTASIHVHHIREKLGFRSRVQVAGWALAQGLAAPAPGEAEPFREKPERGGRSRRLFAGQSANVSSARW